MDDEDFEKRLNKEKSFLTSKNHTAEFEKQLEKHKEEYRIRDDIEKRKQDSRRLFSNDDILESSDSSSGSGIGGLMPAFIGILVALIIGVGVAIPVITDTMGEAINSTEIGGVAGTIIYILPLMIGLVLFVSVGVLVRLRR